MNPEQELQNLRTKREHHITRIFWLGLEIAVILGIPAALAAVIGTKVFDGGTMLLVLLACAFVLSWTIIIWRYQTLSKKMERLDTRIQELKNQIEQSSDK